MTKRLAALLIPCLVINPATASSLGTGLSINKQSVALYQTLLSEQAVVQNTPWSHSLINRIGPNWSIRRFANQLWRRLQKSRDDSLESNAHEQVLRQIHHDVLEFIQSETSPPRLDVAKTALEAVEIYKERFGIDTGLDEILEDVILIHSPSSGVTRAEPTPEDLAQMANDFERMQGLRPAALAIVRLALGLDWPINEEDASTPGGAPGILFVRLLKWADPKATDQGWAAGVWALAGIFDGLLGGGIVYLLWGHPVVAILTVLSVAVILHGGMGVIARDRRGWYVKGWKILQYRRQPLPYLLEPANFRQLLFAISAFSSTLLALTARTPWEFVLAAVVPPISINLLYLLKRLSAVAKEKIGAIVIYLALIAVWGYLDPRLLPPSHHYELLRILPVSAFSGFVSGIFDDRVESNGKGRKTYTHQRLKALSRQILYFVMMDIVYSAPIEGSVIYLWVLHWIPGQWIPALVDAAFLSPFLVDPVAFYIGKRVFNPGDEGLSSFGSESHQHALEGLRQQLVRFYIRTLPAWFLSVLITMYLPIPVLSFAALNAGIIWWSLEAARAVRKDYNPAPVRYAQWWGVRHFLIVMQKFLDQPWLGAYLQAAILGLYMVGVGRQLYLWDLHQAVWTWTFLSLVIGWGYLHIRHVLWPTPWHGKNPLEDPQPPDTPLLRYSA